MTNEDLNRKIRDVVRLCTGMAPDGVRPAHQLGPTLSGAFASVLVMTNEERGLAEIKHEDIAGDPAKRVRETATTQDKATASIQFFRAGAVDLATKLKRRIQMTDAQDLMTSHGLGFVSSSNVRNLTAVVNEAWEERAQIDIEFHHVTSEAVDVNTYGDFPINVKMSTTGSVPQSTSTEVFEP